MTKLLRGGAAAIAICLAVAAARSEQPAHAGRAPTVPTFLGIVRADGLLVPIAVYDGRDWWNRWPWAAESEAVKALPIPPTVADVPAEWLPPGLSLPSIWKLQRDRGPLAIVRVGRPVRPSGWNLMDTIALRTDIHPGPVAPRGSAPEAAEESIGVAIAGNGQLGRVVTASAPETDRIFRQLQDRVRQLEDDALARWKKSATDEKGSAPSLLGENRPRPGEPWGSLVKSAADGRAFYYFDRGYRQRVAGDDCALFVSVDGPVIADLSGRVISERLAASVFGEYCGDARESVNVLATVTIGGAPYWVNSVQVEDGYDYGIFDPQRGDSVPLKGGWGTAAMAARAHPHTALDQFAIQPMRSSSARAAGRAPDATRSAPRHDSPRD